MGEVILNLLPVVLGAALVPLYPIIVLLLLQSEGGLRKAVAFVAGGVTLRLAQGVLFGALFNASSESHTDEESGLVVATLLLVVGVLLLVNAFRYWRKVEDPDAPPPAWMATISSMTAAKAFGAGALYVAIAIKQWVFTLSALSIITEATLDAGTSVGLYVGFVIATQLLVLPPIIAFTVAPRQTAAPLRAAQGWLERNNRVIVMVVSVVFGTWFLYKGISGLL